MKVHVISDLHIDAVSHGVPRREEILSSVDVSLGLIEKGDAFLFAGDLCDPGSNRSYQAIADAIQIDRRARDEGAGFIAWLIGNHDVLEDGSGGSVLDPLRAAGALVCDKPARFEYGGVSFVMLPHVAIANRYDPEEALARLESESGTSPVVVLGHLNPEGITPGSETTLMPRGREVFWPPIYRDPRILWVGGHIHRAQEYRGLHIVGSPVRFDAGEKDHEPKTFTARRVNSAWKVERQAIGHLSKVRLRRFIDCDDFVRPATTGLFYAGDFVRAVDEGENRQAVEKQGAVFISIPKAVAAIPKASVSREAKKHRRVREVVLDVAKVYPSTKVGLLDRVERTMTESGL